MRTLWQDIRYGARALLKSPGFAAVTVLVLALGIGANTAIFSVVNAILLRPLPYAGPERLVVVWESNPKRGWGIAPTSYPNFTDLRDQNGAFEALGAFTDTNFNLTGGDEPERVKGMLTSTSIFSLLGVKPHLGRVFLPEEDQQAAGGRSVILSYGLWQRRFGSDPNINGRSVALNGASYTVVGVMPSDFAFPPAFTADVGSSRVTIPAADLWVPLTKDSVPPGRDVRSLYALGRLKDGVTLEQAQAEMNVVARRLEGEYPAPDTGMEVRLVPMREQVVGDVRLPLLVLLGAVGFVMLIACANVANLLLAKAAGRQKEMAIRLAVGATRGRIVRQLLTESVLLSLLGAAPGLLLARWGLRLLAGLGSSSVPRIQEAGLDPSVLLFTLGVSLLTAVVFGILPALQASRSDLQGVLKEGGRHSGAGSRGQRLRGLLVAAEVALSLVLLICAGLMIKSLLRLQQVNPGFDPHHALALEIFLPETRYAEPHQQAAFQKQLLERVGALPGVRHVATVDNIPFGENETYSSFSIEDQPPPDPSARPRAYFRTVSPDYFRAMDIAVADGRGFTEQDAPEGQLVAMVNEAAAKRWWPGGSPLNKRLKLGRPDSKNPWMTVVGVSSSVSHTALGVAPQPEVYLPFAQHPGGSFALVVRSAAEPGGVAASVQREAAALDRDLPVSKVLLMDDLVARSIAQPRLYAWLLILFAGFAVVLTAVGIYGVIAYSVTQRTHEIGIRMALGAQPRRILKMVVGQAMLLTLVGMAAGLFLAFALTRVLASLLYGVGANDPQTFAFGAALVLFVALLASLIPAIRSTKVNPLVALRHE